MNGVLLAGLGITVVALVGYVVGVIAPYPGRSFTVAGVMLGVTLLAISRGVDQ